MNQKEAKKILPKSEYEAFESIFMNQVSRTPSGKLKQRATMARRLREKYNDLAHRQAAGTRARRTNEVETDIYIRRTRLFQEVIDFLEEELSQPRHFESVRPSRRKARAVSDRNHKKERDEKLILNARRRERSEHKHTSKVELISKQKSV